MERVKIEMKFSFGCKAKELFLALTRPELLEGWMADKVTYIHKSDSYAFHWGDSIEHDSIVEQQANRFLQWSWESETRSKDEHLTFRINVIPDDDWIDLHIEDYCDANETKILKEDWDDQIKRLSSLL